MICKSFLLLAVALSAMAQNWPGIVVENFQAGQTSQSGHADSDYEKGMRALDARQWDQAIAFFEESRRRKSGNADAAMYWKAYAESRAGRYDRAMELISDLRADYPSSRWINDAQALEVEMRGQSGAPVSPSTESNDDVKLIALNSLMQSDPDRAVPIVQKVLNGNSSEKVKDRAMFVLTQSSSPEARRILVDIAKNSSNPDLQKKAIRYIGMMGGPDARNELASVYNSTSDVRLKSEILRSFMQSGSRDLLLHVAKTEQNPDLRRDAIRQLALTGGQDELWQLYQSSSSVDDKKMILESMFLGGNSARLVEIAKTEKDPALRVSAIKSLGLMGGNGRGDVLVSIYQSDQNYDVRNAILNALFLQQNGKALVDLARSEKDPQLKRRIIEKMALVHSKETTDYMLELLK